MGRKIPAPILNMPEEPGGPRGVLPVEGISTSDTASPCTLAD